MSPTYKGDIIADSIKIRFTYSGTIKSVVKSVGDTIAPGTRIASLDRTLAQKELDRQLSDYEKIRARFEQFKIRDTGTTDIDKYQRTFEQATLDLAVHDIEIAKHKLDRYDLVSPVAGLITDMDNVTPGVHITPSSAPVTILVTDTIRFVFEIKQKDIQSFLKPRDVTIQFDGIVRQYVATTRPIAWGDEGEFDVVCDIKDASGLLIGMRGEALPVT